METQTPPVIVAATDFSDTANAALDWAVELARQQRGRVELVHAVTVPPSMTRLVGRRVAPAPMFRVPLLFLSRVPLLPAVAGRA